MQLPLFVSATDRLLCKSLVKILPRDVTHHRTSGSQPVHKPTTSQINTEIISRFLNWKKKFLIILGLKNLIEHILEPVALNNSTKAY